MSPRWTVVTPTSTTSWATGLGTPALRSHQWVTLQPVPEPDLPGIGQAMRFAPCLSDTEPIYLSEAEPVLLLDEPGTLP